MSTRRNLPNIPETTDIWFSERDASSHYSVPDEETVWDLNTYLHGDIYHNSADEFTQPNTNPYETSFDEGADNAWYYPEDLFEQTNALDRTCSEYSTGGDIHHIDLFQKENFNTTGERPLYCMLQDDNYSTNTENHENYSTVQGDHSSTTLNDSYSLTNDGNTNFNFHSDESSDLKEVSTSASSSERSKGFSEDRSSFDADDEDEEFDGNNNQFDGNNNMSAEINMGEDDLLLQDGTETKKKKEPCLCCPPGFCRFLGQSVYNFFHGPPDSYVPLKTVLGFPFGLVLAFGLHHALVVPMNLKGDTQTLVAGLLVLIVSCGFALSVQVRCIVMLLIPTFFGKQGRSYIGTFAVAYLVSGPVKNIMQNGKEVTRSLACAAELSANHTSAKWQLKMKPLEDVMSQFQSEGLYLKKVVKRVDTAFEPLKKEVRDQEDTEAIKQNTARVDRLNGNKRGNRLQAIQESNKFKKTDSREKKAEKKFRGKMSLQCENVWNEGVLRCRAKFADLEKRCHRSIPFIGYLLCLPFKLTFFCELVRLVQGAVGMNCDAADVVNPGFGETYVASEDMMNTMDEGFEVNLQYKLVNTKEELDYTSAEEIRKGTMHEFEQKQKWMEFITTFLSRLLGFTFLRVIFSSFKYNEKYLSDFKFDNIYITDYFKHIDRRRKNQGKRGLIPLKKNERCGLIEPWSKKITQAEKKKLSKGTFMLIMRMLITGVIIYSDYLLYTVLDIIRRHSRVDYAQIGKHEVKVRVYGVGFMANIVRMFISSFDSKHEIKQQSSNFACLPNPIKLDPKDIGYIYMFYGLVWVCMIFEAYGLRLRRLVASFFYRKREKARILFLFNDMYKKRRGFIRHIRKEVRRKVRKNSLSKKTNLLASLRREFPKLLGWLKRFESAKELCLICEQPEDKKYVRCKTTSCNFGYCAECWEDVHHTCYACTYAGSDDSVFSEDETESSGVEEL